MSPIKKKQLLRILLYALGMVTLALGITLNTKVSLGVSPIVSVAYCMSEIFHWGFGNATFLWYSIFVAVEIVLILLKRDEAWKRKLISALLQLPLSLVFTRFMNLFSDVIPVFQEAYPDSFPGSFAGRFLLLLLAVVLTGVGAALSLDMQIVPNPGEGIVQAFVDFTGKKTGTVKNLLDLSCVLISLCVGLLVTRGLLGIGVGTVIAALGVGRVVALFQHLFLEKTKFWNAE